MYKDSQFLGRISTDIIFKELGGKPYCTFQLAINNVFDRTKEAEFFTFEAWGNQADTITKYVKKGDELFIAAEPKQQKYEDKEGKQVSKIVFAVREFRFPSKKKAEGEDKK